MGCRTMLAIASLLATGSQAYAPIQMVSGQGKGLVVLPRGFPSFLRGALAPQKLSVRNPASHDSPSAIPYFTAKLDQTITWDDSDWCLEATGNTHGDAVRVNSCSGAQTQKWNWIPDGRGHNMIQLKDTELCMDVIDMEVGSNEGPIGLWGCGTEVAQWQFEEPLPSPGISGGDDHWHKAWHALMTVLALVGVGLVSLGGAKIWQGRATRSQHQETIPAVMALSMLPSSAPRTRSISMAESEADPPAPEAKLTWNTAIDGEGKTYYWNSEGASTYEKPADFDPATAKAAGQYEQKPKISAEMREKMISEARASGADPNSQSPFLLVFAGVGVLVLLGYLASQ